MKVVLKFHSTLTGGVDDKIKNLKPLNKLWLILLYVEANHVCGYSWKIPPYPHGLSGCVEIFFNFKISHAWEDIDK